MVERSSQPVKNPRRRLMLTLGLTGVVAFILGKIFGDNDNYFLPNAPQGPVKETKFTNFTLTESEGEIVLTDNGGEEIFIVEKQ